MIVIRPVTSASARDFEAFFSAKGCPGYCWCARYRFHDAHMMDKAAKRRAMMARFREGTPVGVLAYDDDEPVGWCSMAPRETYEKLERSTVMPDLGEEGIWTVLCLFVRRERRGEGLAHQLLEGAIRYARGKRANVIEAYPWDTAGVTSRHFGHSKLYKAAGFVPDEGRRWVRRLSR